MHRMRHKINFSEEYSRFKFRAFLSPRPVSLPRLQTLLFLTMYPYLGREQMDSCLSQWHYREEKVCKVPNGIYQRELRRQFPMKAVFHLYIVE